MFFTISGMYSSCKHTDMLS